MRYEIKLNITKLNEVYNRFSLLIFSLITSHWWTGESYQLNKSLDIHIWTTL